ncbi:MAG: winged helix-turn-helix domain-containing protein [Anaerolineae bacterium]|nr:winged helix-turn-helix domain-containing protein [Anaerolineae bacterium]
MQLELFTCGQALAVLRTHIQVRLEDLQEDSTQAEALNDLLEDLNAWAKRFAILVAPDEKTPRLRNGLKTPQSAYHIPILRALVDLGGEAGLDAVLERVQALMADQLNAYDLDTFADGKTIRWRNTAQWARNTLREEGLIRDDTPRGVWAISDAGRKWLKAPKPQ